MKTVTRAKFTAIRDIIRAKSFLYGTRSGVETGRSGLVWDRADWPGLASVWQEVNRKILAEFGGEIKASADKAKKKRAKPKKKGGRKK